MSLGHIEPSQVRPIEPEEYDRLVSLGFFEGERVELIHRVLVTMSPQGGPHIWTINRLNKLLVLKVHDRADVQIQGPLGLADSRPEPDVALLALATQPDALASTALLVIEVAESSVDYDRQVKTDLYATADVPEYWIVNIPDREVEVHREPRAGRYRQTTTVAHDGSITLVSFPDVTIPIADFLR